MKTLLVMPNYNYGGRYCISLGLMYVSSYLKQQGFDVSALNLNHYHPGKLAEELRRVRYDVVATGGLFTYYPNLRSMIGCIRRVSPDSKVVLGGAVATADSSFAMESLRPDFLVMGEGEAAMAELLRALRDGGDIGRVPGIGFMRDGTFVATPPPEPLDLEKLPWPDYDGFEYDRFLDDFSLSFDQNSFSPFPVRRMVHVVSGRGCVAACTFCFRLMPRYRQRSIGSVMAEIRHLKERHGINEAVIIDDLFANTKDRIREFCGRIKELGIAWYCQLRVPVVTRELLDMMKASGCILVSYGLESASETVLRSMRKGITVKGMEQALAMTHQARLTVHGNFIFGDPAETPETIEETFRFFRRHKDTFSNSINLGVIIPYPGSILYNDLLRRGKIKDREAFARAYSDESGQPVNMTAMSDRDFRALVRETIPREWKGIRVFGRVLDSRKERQDFFAFSYVCPFCHERSDLRMVVDVANPIVSFRVACGRCLQRSFVRKAELLGLWGSAVFAWKRLLTQAWEGIRSSRPFMSVRYHKDIDRAWEEYKEELVERSLREGGGANFFELAAGSAIAVRVRFFLRLCGRLVKGSFR